MPSQDDQSQKKKPVAETLLGSHLCVVSPSCFTEACFSVPAVRALKHFTPERSISVLCPKSQMPLWRHGLDEVDHLIDYEDRASAKKIASLVEGCTEKFDSTILWEASNAAKACKIVGIDQCVGYANEELMPLLTNAIACDSSAGPIEHRVRHYLGLVNQLGAEAFVPSSFEKPPLPPAPEQIVIAIAPFSEYGSSYQWPAERFVKVVEVMQNRYPQIGWTLYGHSLGANKKSVGFFKDLLEQENFNQSDTTDSEVFTALAKSTALLACDGEVAHMAAHVGLPAAVIFGPNAPEWKRPMGKQSVVIREHVACSPCFKPKCPIDLRCHNEVSADAVVQALESVIDQRH
ncbi:MAG: glycosyltransferase family 9 protein [Akkermansiaceae bacterium]